MQKIEKFQLGTLFLSDQQNCVMKKQQNKSNSIGSNKNKKKYETNNHNNNKHKNDTNKKRVLENFHSSTRRIKRHNKQDTYGQEC